MITAHYSKKIRSIEDLVTLSGHKKKILTLFSGGLDSTYILKILSQLDFEVIALSVDTGEENIDLDNLEKTTNLFNAKLIIVDAKERFISEAIIPAIQSQAKYLNMFPISSSLSRPIIAAYAIEIAREEGVDIIIHTANQSQNSLRRLNGAIEDLGYEGYYGSPYEYSAITREEKTKLLSDSQLIHFEKRMVSGDSNLWCREFESGILDNPEDFNVPSELYLWSAPQRNICKEEITIHFENGVPKAIDNNELSLEQIIYKLNFLVGSFELGRYCGLEHLDGGEKVLEVREAPAAYILMESYKHLEMAIHDANLLREKIAIEQIWTKEAVEGRWYGSLKIAAQKFIETTAKDITGSIKFVLERNSCFPVSIISKNGKYLTDRDNWEVKVSIARGSRNIVWEKEDA